MDVHILSRSITYKFIHTYKSDMMKGKKINSFSNADDLGMPCAASC